MESQFAALLRRHRTAARLTQDELSAVSGISVQAISTLERGTRRYPQPATVAALADALKLTGDQRAALSAAASRRGKTDRPAPPEPSSAVSPRQLPFASGDFTGRVQELAELSRYLIDSPAVSVTAITGMGGIGKTTLAIHVAHEVAEHFPDGQLYLDLRGFGLGPPLEPLEALTYLLEDLGEVPPADLPTAASRFRTALAERRLVLLLDNAADHEQVRQLLPGAGGCAVVVTSRRSMAGLGCRQYHLGEPPLHESIEMLRRISGRADAPEDECAEVVRQCGGLPLAIRMAGARLASRPSWPVAHLADRLADGRRRLDELQLDDSGVRATLVLSIEQLAGSDDPIDVQAVSMFALLGLAESPDLTAELAAALSDSPEPEAETVLERLVDVHLLTTPTPGRYRLHDLVRVAAREFAEQTLSAEDRLAATTQWITRVRAVVWRASEYAGHGVTRTNWLDEEWLKGADDLPTQDDVLGWLDTERSGLVPTIQRATIDQPALAVQVAVGLNAYYALRRAWLDWLQVNEAVLRLVKGGPDRIAEGLVLHDLGAAHAELDQYQEAVGPLRQAVDAADKSGDGNLQALCLSSLSHVLERTGRTADGIPYAERAREIGLRLGIPPRAAWACLALGMLYLKTGAADAARRHFDEALGLLVEPGLERYRGMIAQNIGVSYREDDQYELAGASLRQSLELYRQAGAAIQQAEVLNELGKLCLAQGRLDEAVTHQSEGLAIAGQYGDWLCEADIRKTLGEVRLLQGRLPEARREWRIALSIREQHNAHGTAELRDLLNLP
ncbi:transcriptional regulator, XRE family [Kribbella flavida DSM 17836]|uniref:Transcriptional regulator, XRE family n=1 Tax=Kribbella flavida (strain DSM 17836 / JCM 10339 / NBRC 14399) TaxID=479435 RepID=D2PN57_KRIFD|nr:tetratricopeptide repeat protein [Kribbella flavida]ADB34541.1 transcriptional regulator, XRE family [Kribbella flavida DSM 17836]